MASTTLAGASPTVKGAPFRLELVAFGAPVGKRKDMTQLTCPAGLVLADHKCTAPRPDRGHVCKRWDLGDCTTQCGLHDAGSCTMLGLMYETGIGANKEPARAVALYEQGCSGGHPPGCYDLGMTYERGKVVNKDLTRAVVLLAQACDGRAIYACRALGQMYQTANGVARDDARAWQGPQRSRGPFPLVLQMAAALRAVQATSLIDVSRAICLTVRQNAHCSVPRLAGAAPLVQKGPDGDERRAPRRPRLHQTREQTGDGDGHLSRSCFAVRPARGERVRRQAIGGAGARRRRIERQSRHERRWRDGR
jgi:hypothetical protein